MLSLCARSATLTHESHFHLDYHDGGRGCILVVNEVIPNSC
jgi:hypothetical protein